MSYATYSLRELNEFLRFLRELTETGELPEQEAAGRNGFRWRYLVYIPI